MTQFINSIRVIDFLDIILVTVFIYYALLWFHKSRAFQLFKGFIFIVLLFIISKWLQLYTIEWLMQKMATVILVLLIIVFQPELRRALERLGRHSLLNKILYGKKGQDIGFLNEIIHAAEALSKTKTGALIVLEKNTGLVEYMESGLKLDANISGDLIISIFQKHSPLHDGAIILQGNTITAARCLLPLTENKLIDQRLGTRHRAALGISELSDAVVIIVSEETGTISIAENGILHRYLTKEELKEKLLVSKPKKTINQNPKKIKKNKKSK